MKIFKIYKEDAEIPAPTTKNPARTKIVLIDKEIELSQIEMFDMICSAITEPSEQAEMLEAYMIGDSDIIHDLLKEGQGGEVREWNPKKREFREIDYRIEF